MHVNEMRIEEQRTFVRSMRCRKRPEQLQECKKWARRWHIPFKELWEFAKGNDVVNNRLLHQ